MAKFCANCGSEMEKDATFCTNCGSSNDGTVSSSVESSGNGHNGMATAGFILAFFVPILGLIFSIIGVKKASQFNGNGRGLAIAGIIISVVSWILYTIFYTVYFADLFSSLY